VLLKLLKVALLLITSAVGIYGTTHEFKKEGNLTHAGRLAVVGLLICGLLAIALQFVEFNKEEQVANVAKRELDSSTARQNATLEQTNRANKALAHVVGDVDRSLHQITSVAVSFRIDVATNSPRMKAYVNRVQRGAQQAAVQLQNKKTTPDWLGWSKDQDHVVGVNFPAQSPLGPQKTEQFARAVFGPLEMYFQFYRTPIDPISREATFSLPDLSFSVFAGTISHDSLHPDTIEYDMESGQFRLEFDHVAADPKSWNGNGKIVAVPDLEGAQMFVTLRSFGSLDDSAANKDLRKLQKAAAINTTLILHITGGRDCYIDMMQRLESSDLVYVFVFPKGEDFRRLVR